MKDSFYIQINKISTLYEFLEDVKSLPNKIIATQGLKIVDAKSIFDLLTLDLKNQIMITVFGEIGLGNLYRVRKYITRY